MFGYKRILRIRTGHLANFSAGAGFVPFVMIFSIPASLLSTIIANAAIRQGIQELIKQRSEKEKLREIEIAQENNTIEDAENAGDAGDTEDIEINDVIIYTKEFLEKSAAFSFVSILVLLFIALGVAGDSGSDLEALFMLLLAGGPFVGFFASVLTFVLLTNKRGFKKLHSLYAFLAYIASTFLIIYWGFWLVT